MALRACLAGCAALAMAVVPFSGVQAQQVDCAEPVSQFEMTACAAVLYEAADGDLNLAYGLAMAKAGDLDADLAADEVTGEAMLRDAQRAWIAFRDLACAAESNLARGGTMQSQLLYICLERLTRQRTEDLRHFGEVN